MDSRQLTHLLKTNPRTARGFLGVFAADQEVRLPRQKRAFTLIFNTDPARKPGQHWVAVFCSAKKKILEFFDPFGQPPNAFIQRFLKKIASNYFWNAKTIQSFSSNICGFYVALYCYYRIRGMSMDKFIRRYETKNFYANDCKTIREFKKIFKVNTEPTQNTKLYCTNLL